MKSTIKAQLHSSLGAHIFYKVGLSFPPDTNLTDGYNELPSEAAAAYSSVILQETIIFQPKIIREKSSGSTKFF
jgi:hypothetical protein